MDLVWTGQLDLRRKDKKFALEFLIYVIVPAGGDEATPAVGAAAVQVVHAEEAAGRYETTPVVGANAVLEIQAEALTGRDKVTQEVGAAAATKEATNLSGSHAVGPYINDRRRRNQTPRQVGRDEISLAIDAVITAPLAKTTSLSGRQYAEAEVPSEGITAPATAAANQ